MQHFITWTGALLQLLESFLTNGTDPRAVKRIIAAIHDSMCFFRDACGSEAKQVSLISEDGDALDWVREFNKITSGADVPAEWRSLLDNHYPTSYAQGITPGAETQAAVSSRQDVFANFVRLSLFIVQHLFRRVTKESSDSDGQTVLRLADGVAGYPEDWRRAVLEQIERMVPMTIKALDASSQRFYKLPTEAFRLFSDCEVKAPYWSVEDDGVLNLLTLSILKGLWPDAMIDLVSFVRLCHGWIKSC